MRIAERHFTADEFSALMAEIADGSVDIRIYDDGIVLMRDLKKVPLSAPNSATNARLCKSPL